MSITNKELHGQVSKKILANTKNASSTSDGVFILSIYYDKKKGTSDAQTFINGLKPIEAEVLIKEVYARIYAERVKNDPKMKKINADLEKRRQGK
jgi:hypothetical protein